MSVVKSLLENASEEAAAISAQRWIGVVMRMAKDGSGRNTIFIDEADVATAWLERESKLVPMWTYKIRYYPQGVKL